MGLRDAHVEVTVRKRLVEDVGAGPARHCGRDGHDARVVPGQIGQPSAEHLLITGQPRRLLGREPGDLVPGGGRVPLDRILLGRLVALPLLGDQVNQHRAAHPADPPQRVDHRVDVVSVERPEVAEPQLLEEHAGNEEVLHALLELARGGLHHVGDARGDTLHQLADLIADPVVERVGDDAVQVLVHRPDVGSDRHVVVVEDHDEVAVARARVVEGFVGEPAADGAVPDDRDDVEVLTLVIASDGHPDRGRDGGRGVSRAEDVEVRLGTAQEGSQPALAANGVQLVVAPRQDLVDVGLVARVPHHPVAGRVEHVVKRHRELGDAQASSEMSADLRHDIDQALAHLANQVGQLGPRQLAHVPRLLDVVQDRHPNHSISGCLSAVISITDC